MSPQAETVLESSSPAAQYGPLTSAHEAVLPLIRIIQDAGVSVAAITAATGIDLGDLDDPNLRVRLSAMDWLMRKAGEVRGDPAIGLNLIQLYPDNHMHYVAHMAMRCATLGEAILQWRDYARLVCDADEIGFAMDRDGARLTYTLLDPRFTAPHFAEHYLSMAVFYGRRFCGEHICPRAVHFRHADPGYRDQLEAFFGCPVMFGMNDDALVIPPDIIAKRNITADAYMEKILSAQADVMMREIRSDDVEYRVRRNIAATLARGGRPALSQTASDIAMSTRSLSRALKERGTTFSELTDTLRQSMAEHYLRDGLSVTQTAYFLGFSDPGALHSAFQRWKGMTVREFVRGEADGQADGQAD